MTEKTTLILGANSAIGKALSLQIIKQVRHQLIVVSRDVKFYQDVEFQNEQVIKVPSYEEAEIERTIKEINQGNVNSITQVFICHGVLHNQHYQPEKKLEDFTPEAFSQIITANTVTPMLWLKHLIPLLANKSECKIAVFSARVGSISDNRLGGWYSYRASKAAMNMLVKSAAVELSRRAKNIKLILFHPGTTDTPLSAPFQKNVPEGKLFTSNFVASQLLNIVKEMPIDGEASFVDWQAQKIPW